VDVRAGDAALVGDDVAGGIGFDYGVLERDGRILRTQLGAGSATDAQRVAAHLIEDQPARCHALQNETHALAPLATAARPVLRSRPPARVPGAPPRAP